MSVLQKMSITGPADFMVPQPHSWQQMIVKIIFLSDDARQSGSVKMLLRTYNISMYYMCFFRKHTCLPANLWRRVRVLEIDIARKHR